MSNIDPYAIASLGRITTNENALVFDGLGYFVFVEELPPVPPPITDFGIDATGQIFDKPKESESKYYRVKVTFEDDIPTFDKTIQMEDINVVISDVKLHSSKNKVVITIKNVKTNTYKDVIISLK